MLHVGQIIIPHVPDVDRIWSDNMLLSGVESLSLWLCEMEQLTLCSRILLTASANDGRAKQIVSKVLLCFTLLEFMPTVLIFISATSHLHVKVEAHSIQTKLLGWLKRAC